MYRQSVLKMDCMILELNVSSILKVRIFFYKQFGWNLGKMLNLNLRKITFSLYMLTKSELMYGNCLKHIMKVIYTEQ